MPRIVWSRPASLDVSRLISFLAPKSERAAGKALRAIYLGVRPLGKYPEMGRMVNEDRPGIRDWFVEFGQSAYVIRYEFDTKLVIVLRVRHGREDGF